MIRIVAAACALAFLPGCAIRQGTALPIPGNGFVLPAPTGYRAHLSPGIWALERVTRDRRSIWIRSAESGCNHFHHAEVRETEGGIRVKVVEYVLVPATRKYGCLLPLYASRHRIELPTELRAGERVFGGCVEGKHGGDRRICHAMERAASP